MHSSTVSIYSDVILMHGYLTLIFKICITLLVFSPDIYIAIWLHNNPIRSLHPCPGWKIDRRRNNVSAYKSAIYLQQ